MATNPYVRLFDDYAEQTLIQELSDETLQMYGFDVVYLPATLRREDRLYNEDILRRYTKTFAIEAYLVNAEGWQGQNNLMSKFGLQLNQQFSIRVSRRRFNELIAQYTGQSRPLEGDMIYFGPPFNRMFEIVFVEHQNQPGQFYPLGALTYYQLNLELHTQNQEQVTTTDSHINQLYDQSLIATELVMSIGGTGSFVVGEHVYQGSSVTDATASATVADWSAASTTLKIHTRKGEFAEGAPVVGVTSGATYFIGAPPNMKNNVNEDVDDNDFLDVFAQNIVDTREVNRSQGN